MRLTLRTMLAYMDNVLSPADAKELGEKIKDSKFADDLVHRIRNSMRRLRLGAPPIDGKGMGDDPNTVAEYLDSTLPGEQVPEFEKVCLESDVQLAEVAACHQILTIVLRQPAEVEPRLRDRIYRLGNGKADGVATPAAVAPDLEAVPKTSAAADALAAMRVGNPQMAASSPQPQSTGSGSGRRDGSRISIKSLALTLLLTFVLAIVALRAIDDFDRDHLVLRWLTGRPAPQESVPGKEVADRGDTDQAADTKSEGASTAASADGTDANGESQPSSIPGESSPVPTSEQTVDPLVGLADPRSGEATGSAPATPSGTGTASSATPPTVSPPEIGAGSPAEDSGAPSARPPRTPTPEMAPSVEVEPRPTVVADGTPVGRFVSEQQVLARYNSSAGSWERVRSDSSLAAGDQLLAFPTYRPKLILTPGVKVTLVDGSRAELMVPSPEGTPRLAMSYGAALAMPVVNPPAGLGLKLGPHEGILSFGDMESAAAIETRRYLPLGENPETAPARIVTQVFCVGGEVSWQPGDERTVVVPAGSVLTSMDDMPFELTEAVWWPTWIEPAQQQGIEARASRELAKALAPDRPLALSLLERTDFRQQEVVDLACRSLCLLDVYEPLVKAFSDKRQHSYWGAQVAAMQDINSHDPESAARLRRVFEELHAADAEILSRISWGYSTEQLALGGAEQLVDQLESDNMAVRVLAFETLKRITGMTQLYRPESPPGQEKAKVAKWRRALEEGRIVYQPPDVAPEAPPETP